MYDKYFTQKQNEMTVIYKAYGALVNKLNKAKPNVHGITPHLHAICLFLKVRGS